MDASFAAASAASSSASAASSAYSSSYDELHGYVAHHHHQLQQLQQLQQTAAVLDTSLLTAASSCNSSVAPPPPPPPLPPTATAATTRSSSTVPPPLALWSSATTTAAATAASVASVAAREISSIHQSREQTSGNWDPVAWNLFAAAAVDATGAEDAEDEEPSYESYVDDFEAEELPLRTSTSSVTSSVASWSQPAHHRHVVIARAHSGGSSSIVNSVLQATPQRAGHCDSDGDGDGDGDDVLATSQQGTPHSRFTRDHTFQPVVDTSLVPHAVSPRKCV
jgi:hypothetical protein